MAGESERTKEPESQRARDERAREGERGRASERASERERERERESNYIQVLMADSLIKSH